MGPFGHLTTKDAESLAFVRTICDFGRPVNWSRWSFCDTRVRSLYHSKLHETYRASQLPGD
jgi:hypothetical protein